MWTRLLLLGAVAASLTGLFISPAPAATATPAVAGADDIHVTGPYLSGGNLTVYLVHGPNLLGDKQYLTLTQGLAETKVIVHEQKEVNELSIENLSDMDLFVQAGEIVKGGQQDRTLGEDLVVSAHRQMPIPVNCVEHGRWTQRGDESKTVFASSDNALASKDLKANNYAHNQQGVWDSVSKAQQRLGNNTAMAGSIGSAAAPTTSPSSLELSLDDAAVQRAAKEYETQINKTAKPDADIIGFIYAINEQLDSGDVYASPELFAQMYPKLLHAAAVEALAERDPRGRGKTRMSPTPAAVEAMLKQVDAAKPDPQSLRQESIKTISEATRLNPGPNHTTMVKKQTKELTLYETRDTQTKAAFLHRAYLAN